MVPKRLWTPLRCCTSDNRKVWPQILAESSPERTRQQKVLVVVSGNREAREDVRKKLAKENLDRRKRCTNSHRRPKFQ